MDNWLQWTRRVRAHAHANYAGWKSSKKISRTFYSFGHFNKIFGEEFLNDAWNFIVPNYVYAYYILKNSNYNDSFQVNSSNSSSSTRTLWATGWIFQEKKTYYEGVFNTQARTYIVALLLLIAAMQLYACSKGKIVTTIVIAVVKIFTILRMNLISIFFFYFK